MKSRTLVKSFGYAFDGLSYAFSTQRNFRLHTAAGVLTLLLGWHFHFSPAEMVLLVLTISQVLIAELFNTAVETAIDLYSPEYHPLAKIAKNVAAGAVLVSACAALLVAAFLFLPRLR